MTKPVTRTLAGGAIICLLVLTLGAVYCVFGRSVRASSSETVRRSRTLLSEGKSIEARECLDWLLWFEPDNAAALLAKGLAFHVDRRFDESVQILRRVSDETYEFHDTSLVLARSYLQLHELDNAESVLNTGLRRFPGSDEVREELIQLYMAQMRKREAIALLYDRWRLYPDDLVVLRSLLLAIVEPVTPQGRLIYFETVESARPGQAAVGLASARAASLVGDCERANVLFEAALRKRPNHEDTMIFAAEFFMNQGEIERADKLIRVMTDHDEAVEDDRLWMLVARKSALDEDLNGGLEAIERALVIRPRESSYLTVKASLLRQMGRRTDAELVAKRAAAVSDAKSRLFVLVDEINLDRPSRHQCRELANLLTELGYEDQAAGWKLVGEMLD